MGVIRRKTVCPYCSGFGRVEASSGRTFPCACPASRAEQEPKTESAKPASKPWDPCTTCDDKGYVKSSGGITRRCPCPVGREM